MVAPSDANADRETIEGEFTRKKNAEGDPDANISVHLDAIKVAGKPRGRGVRQSELQIERHVDVEPQLPAR